jgi:hypothetical protein
LYAEWYPRGCRDLAGVDDRQQANRRLFRGLRGSYVAALERTVENHTGISLIRCALNDAAYRRGMNFLGLIF